MKNVLDNEKISEALLSNSVGSLAGKGDLILLHDPSDIRKKHSKELEGLGKVLSLEKQVINGYSSFNTVAVDVYGKDLTLLGTEIYSNKMPNYVTQEELKKQEKPCSEEATEEERQRYEEVTKRVSERDYINLSVITKKQLKQMSDRLKNTAGIGELTHVLDRGFDDGSLFDFIDNELKDKFVIRLKLSRVTNEIEINTEGKKRAIKINEHNFAESQVVSYQKLMIKNKVYQDIKCIVQFGYKLDGYSVIKIQLNNREGKELFKQPMLLVSNNEVRTGEEALIVYRVYLKRSKIEGVFKFLKDVLGWEEFQIRDFDSIKALLTLCYFIAGYFYEIESVLIEQDFIQFVAHLGGGKGKVTRFYILNGFAQLFTKNKVDAAIEEHQITPEKLKEIMRFAKMMQKGVLELGDEYA